jgi:hypothetical protein
VPVLEEILDDGVGTYLGGRSFKNHAQRDLTDASTGGKAILSEARSFGNYIQAPNRTLGIAAAHVCSDVHEPRRTSSQTE